MCSLKVLREKTLGTGGPKNILGLKFWPKGLFWVSERLQNFFGLQKHTGNFWILHLLSAQINNSINTIYCYGFFGGMVKRRYFFGQTSLEVRIMDLCRPPPPPTPSLKYLILSKLIKIYFEFV